MRYDAYQYIQQQQRVLNAWVDVNNYEPCTLDELMQNNAIYKGRFIKNHVLVTTPAILHDISLSVGRLISWEKYIRLYPDKVPPLTENDLCVTRKNDIKELYMSLTYSNHNEDTNEVLIELSDEEYALLIQAFEYLDMLLPTDVKYAVDEKDATRLLKAAEINKQLKQYIIENVKVF